MEPDTDQWLDQSGPELREPDGLGEVVADVVASTRRAVLPRSRKPRRAVLIGATTAMLVAGGTAAAATAIGGWTEPWADHPVGTLSFQLPSGGTCEQRIGNLHIDNPDAQSLIQDWLSDHTLAQVADVNAALREIRSGPNTWDKNGTEVPVGYGTRHYDADSEYVDAVNRAISTAVSDKLQAVGYNQYTQYVPMTWNGELHCTGSNPTPAVPKWLK